MSAHDRSKAPGGGSLASRLSMAMTSFKAETPDEGEAPQRPEMETPSQTPPPVAPEARKETPQSEPGEIPEKKQAMAVSAVTPPATPSLTPTAELEAKAKSAPPPKAAGGFMNRFFAKRPAGTAAAKPSPEKPPVKPAAKRPVPVAAVAGAVAALAIGVAVALAVALARTRIALAATEKAQAAARVTCDARVAEMASSCVSTPVSGLAAYQRENLDKPDEQIHQLQDQLRTQTLVSGELAERARQWELIARFHWDSRHGVAIPGAPETAAAYVAAADGPAAAEAAAMPKRESLVAPFARADMPPKYVRFLVSDPEDAIAPEHGAAAISVPCYVDDYLTPHPLQQHVGPLITQTAAVRRNLTLCSSRLLASAVEIGIAREQVELERQTSQRLRLEVARMARVANMTRDLFDRMLNLSGGYDVGLERLVAETLGARFPVGVPPTGSTELRRGARFLEKNADELLVEFRASGPAAVPTASPAVESLQATVEATLDRAGAAEKEHKEALEAQRDALKDAKVDTGSSGRPSARAALPLALIGAVVALLVSLVVVALVLAVTFAGEKLAKATERMPAVHRVVVRASSIAEERVKKPLARALARKPAAKAPKASSAPATRPRFVMPSLPALPALPRLPRLPSMPQWRKKPEAVKAPSAPIEIPARAESAVPQRESPDGSSPVLENVPVLSASIFAPNRRLSVTEHRDEPTGGTDQLSRRLSVASSAIMEPLSSDVRDPVARFARQNDDGEMSVVSELSVEEATFYHHQYERRVQLG